MKSEQCQAIILSTLNYGESDRIVSLFTLEHGRLRGFAKSARASRKRFGGMLEPTNRLDLLISLKEDGLSRIEQAHAVRCLPELREQLESLALALYACELVEALTPEGHPLPRLYRLLASMLEYLAGQPATAADQRFFEINLLNILGYCPVMDAVELQPLRSCLKTGSFGKISFTSAELEAAGRLLDHQISGYCNHPLKSRTFLNNLL